MRSKLQIYLDELFATREGSQELSELKLEIETSLQEKMDDYLKFGFSDNIAFQKTIDSIGDIDELISQLTNDKTIHPLDRHEGVDSQGSTSGTYQGSSRRQKLRGAILKDADLRGENHKGVDLLDSDLTRSSLDGANLSEARLSDSELKDTSFRNCDVSGADLTGCNLRGACFDGANLEGTRFTGSILAGASFARATLITTDFRQCD